MHVVEAPGVRRERPDLSGTPSAALPVLRLAGGDAVAEGVSRRRPGATAILPLSLRQQPVRLARPLRKPVHVSLGVLPRHIDRRPPPAAPTLIAGLVRQPGH